jgi:hypothetical protein
MTQPSRASEDAVHTTGVSVVAFIHLALEQPRIEIETSVQH